MQVCILLEPAEAQLQQQRAKVADWDARAVRLGRGSLTEIADSTLGSELQQAAEDRTAVVLKQYEAAATCQEQQDAIALAQAEYGRCPVPRVDLQVDTIKAIYMESEFIKPSETHWAGGTQTGVALMSRAHRSLSTTF